LPSYLIVVKIGSIGGALVAVAHTCKPTLSNAGVLRTRLPMRQKHIKIFRNDIGQQTSGNDAGVVRDNIGLQTCGNNTAGVASNAQVAFENIRKHSKSGAKRLKIFENWCETFENI
jgi:hypothetical protein